MKSQDGLGNRALCKGLEMFICWRLIMRRTTNLVAGDDLKRWKFC